MAEDIYLCLTVSVGRVVIAFMLCVLVRFLDWSKNKALPGTGKPLFNAIVVGLAALITVVPLLNIELVEVWHGLRPPP